MFTRTTLAAAAILLAGCATPPPRDYTDARAECSAQVDQDALASATFLQQLQQLNFWDQIVDPTWKSNPLNPGRLRERVTGCLNARGYPAS